MSIAIMMIKKVVYISLLYLANQLGRKMSKLSLFEEEYFRATTVTGHNPLNAIKTMPSVNHKGSIVFDKEIESHSVARGVLSGNKRFRVAFERAVKQNIEEFITEISKVK